jgi:hypothetical protein
MNLFGKPVLPRDLETALEECGPEIIRTVHPSQERARALEWLKWKDARQSRLGKINFWVTVVAAVAAVLAAIFGYVGR